MVNIRRCDIRALKRRRDFLMQRLMKNGMADTGFSYDNAEAVALDRIIKRYEGEAVLSDGEED
jgi:hypothetical protein